MIDLTGRHPATVETMRRFRYDHLSPELQAVAARFADLAAWLVTRFTDNRLLTSALDDLWDAKNRAVMLAVILAESEDQ
jgi:hypothetical protein